MNRLLPLASLAMVATATAQNLSRGPLAGAPLAFTVEGGWQGAADGRTFAHRNGFAPPFAAFPGNAANQGSPDLAGLVAFHGAPGLPVDDFSTGRDDVMVDANGVLDVPVGGWGVLSWSYRGTPTGVTGTRLRTLLNQAPIGSRGAMVFSWVLPGSIVPAGVADVVEQSHSRQELGLTVAGGTATPDVDGIDLPVVMGFDQAGFAAMQPGFTPLLPLPQAIYFTVPTAARGAVPASWWLQGNVPTLDSGATILACYKSSQFGPWSPPRVAWSYADLGLSRNDDIDGLAVDADDQKILFSLVGGAGSQLQFVDVGTDGAATPQPVTKSDNTPVANAVGGAGTDDIDAVCTLDPEIRNGVYLPDDFGASVGTPVAPYQPVVYPVGMNASAYRRFQGGQGYFDTWLSGWPPATGQGPGLAILAITLGDQVAPAFTVSIQPRAPLSPIPGDPRHYELQVPNAVALQGNFPLVFRWFAVDAGLTEIAQALPLKVFP